MEPFKTINEEIVKNIKQEMENLNLTYEKCMNDLNDFSDKFSNKSIKDIETAKKTINWLKNITIGFRVLNSHINSFPEYSETNENLLFKIDKFDDETLSDEVIKRILPLALIFQQVLFLRNN